MHPTSLAAQLEAGTAFLRDGRADDAAAAFARAAKLAPNDPLPYAMLGAAALRAAKLAYARVNFEQAAKLAPQDANVWHALGNVYERSGWKGKALDAYQHAVALAPGDEAAWRQLGVVASRLKEKGIGRNALMRATALDPDDWRAQLDLGASTLDNGDPAAALRAFSQALAMKPDSAEASVGHAEAKMQVDPSPSSLSSAAAEASRAVLHEPTARGRYVLGRIRLAQREYAAAIQELRSAIQMDPNLTQAYGYLSQAYVASGEPDAARAAGKELQTAYARVHAAAAQARDK